MRWLLQIFTSQKKTSGISRFHSFQKLQPSEGQIKQNGAGESVQGKQQYGCCSVPKCTTLFQPPEINPDDACFNLSIEERADDAGFVRQTPAWGVRNP